MSATSDDLIEPIDFGGRFARQFFNVGPNNNWPNIEGDTPNTSQILNPTTSTPVAHNEHSICDSGYESFHAQHGALDINHNNLARKGSIASSSCVINLDGSPKSNSIISASNAKCASSTTSNNLNLNLNLNLNNSNHHHHHQPDPLTPATSAQNGPPTSSNSNININHHNNSNQNQQQQQLITPDELAKLPAKFGLMHLFPNVVVRQQRSNSLFATPTVSTNPWSTQEVYQRFNNVDKIERAASLHRTAASFSEPQYTWSGQLPSRSYKNPVFSCKVFLGGVPWDVTEQGLIQTFGQFGPLRVQWPGKDVRCQQSGQTKAGYVYLIYESERYVKALLQECTKDFGAGSHPEKYFFPLSSRRMRSKEVQVIPWVLADSNYIRNQSSRPETHRTVFVGALHGMLTAEGLAKIMNDLFGGVAYVGIDSDKYKYPLGSGRCVFYNQRSYMKAVSAAFIEVKSSRFNKKIQVDPYLEPSQCSTCHVQSSNVFCRECLRYFCKLCWNWHHSSEALLGKQHQPLMRKKRET